MKVLSGLEGTRGCESYSNSTPGNFILIHRNQNVSNEISAVHSMMYVVHLNTKICYWLDR